MSQSFKAVLIIVFITFVVLAGLFFFWQRKSVKENTPVFSVIGEILEINNSQIKIKAGVGGNSFGTEKELTTFITATTTFSSMGAFVVIKLEDIHKPILAKEGKLEDLKIGDLILVESSVDLKKAETFTAVSVQVINTKEE